MMQREPVNSRFFDFFESLEEGEVGLFFQTFLLVVLCEMAKHGERKFRSVRRKKRKGFCGTTGSKKRPKLTKEPDQDGLAGSKLEVSDNSDASESEELPMEVNVSASKLQNSSFSMYEEQEGILTRKKSINVGLGVPSVNCDNIASRYKIQDATLLRDCIASAAICSFCRKSQSTLQLFQRDYQREGLAECLFLRCSNCHHETELKTSKRLGGVGGGAHEVNRRSVLASQKLGQAGLADFCARMNFCPPVTKKSYNDHLIQIEKAAVEHARTQMQDAAGRLSDLTKNKHPNSIEDENGTEVAKVAVTVDGTWQKRGHSSKIGVVFVISVATGEILDYEVKSLVCYECRAREHMDRDSEEYKAWKASHTNCHINHSTSSEDMEASAAVEMFGRSVEKLHLKYTTFVGDGDSSSFGRVREAMTAKFGDKYPVVKEECVGHVQKRMGTALRKFKKEMKGRKLADGKGVAGKGRLTDKVINRIQNYYGNAIRENCGNLQGMKESIKAIQCHMIVDEDMSLKKQHRHCPKGKDTWCKFWADMHNKTNTYDNSKRLPAVFMKELDPIFKRLSDNALLSRCLQGFTQNQNESVNSQLWSRCSKTTFVGVRKVQIAVCETVAVFNTGAASKAVIMDLSGVNPGQSMLKALRDQDKRRIVTAGRKVSVKYRTQRKILRAKRKSKGEVSYSSGAFGLDSKPEISVKQGIKNIKSKKHIQELPSTSREQTVEIKYVEPIFEVVVTPKE